MTTIAGKKVLITGGSSGIGWLMAKKLIAKGAAQVILWDIKTPNLQQDSPKLPISFTAVDVSEKEAERQASQQLIDQKLVPDILILNAGVVWGGYFHEQSASQTQKMIDVNVFGVVWPAHFLLPAMIALKRGHIVSISSAAAMIANPRMAIYAATKWAVYGWSESLRLEMQQLKTAIQVSTVTPSFIDTGMFAGAKVNKLLPNLKPEVAASKVVRGIEKNKRFIRMPFLVFALPFLKGVLPASWFDHLIGNGLSVYKSMSNFKGHSK
ncbi:MAG: SDR family NAD(P)-dependent oxidoreductase [Bacteroidetes bacterium]|jgi:all-trans-retinol dehydrogenase (NAD+)|nr:SDR family NAD(P)-dependent oxidoreductase [Bacteroidota bacterium]